MNYSKHSIGYEEIFRVGRTMAYLSLTMGLQVIDFELACRRYLGCAYAIAVGNATEALHLALLAHGVGEGDEVITSPFTFVATVNAIIMTGAKPVFVDVTEWGNIRLDQVFNKINPKTKAILVVDYAGYPVNYRESKKIVSKDIKWIRDAAHSFGAEVNGEKVGVEDTACFSFHPCKPITTAEGGLIATDNKAIAMRSQALRIHGIYKADWKQDMVHFGFNYKMTDIQASIGLEQLKKIDKFQQIREQIAERYYEELAGVDGIKFLPQYRNVGETKSSWHLFPILVENRNQVIKKMWDKDIYCGVHYKPVHLHSWYRKNLHYKLGDFPMAEYLGNNIISLPIYPDLTERQQDLVINTLKKV